MSDNYNLQPDTNSQTVRNGDSYNLDTREQLEADLEKLRKQWKEYDGNFMRIYSYVAYSQIVELLDRQAAITRAECERICDTCEYPDLAEADADACDHIAALQGEVDKLTDENAKLSSDELTARTACDYWRGQFEAIRSRHRLLKEQMAAVLDES